MNDLITEKNYKIENLWFGKAVIIYIFRIFLILLYFGPGIASYFNNYDKLNKNGNAAVGWYYLVITVVYLLPFDLVTAYLQRKNYHYALEQKFLTIKQGIFSKQERHIPYGVIQNIFVKQDLFDRIFGLASLSVENSSQGAGSQNNVSRNRFWMRENNSGNNEAIGSSANKVNIPGLKKQNAEALKTNILQKMKENPLEDSQSGL